MRLVQPRRSLEKSRVQIENIAGVGLASRRPAERRGELTVSPSLLGQVVVAAEHFLALLHEEFAHRAPGVRGDVLQRRRVGRRGGDDDRVIHRAVLFESGGHARDGRRVLPDRDVNADEVLALLVDDRVDQHRGLARESVADDQLALAATDRDHGVDRLDAGLHRAVDALARDHARRDLLDRKRLSRLDRSLVVKWDAQRVHDPAEQRFTNRHLEKTSCGSDLVALVEVPEVAQDHRSDLVLLEVQREAIRLVRKLEQLARHRVLQAVDLGDAVADGDDPSDVGRHEAGVEILEPFFDDLGYLFGADAHVLAFS